jgi:superfamily I DNA and/or RNA helicase
MRNVKEIEKLLNDTNTIYGFENHFSAFENDEYINVMVKVRSNEKDKEKINKFINETFKIITDKETIFMMSAPEFDRMTNFEDDETHYGGYYRFSIRIKGGE